MLRIDRDTIAPILEANPDLIEEMSRVLAERRKHTENRLKDQPSGAAAEPDRKSAEWFVSTIRRYFKLG